MWRSRGGGERGGMWCDGQEASSCPTGQRLWRSEGRAAMNSGPVLPYGGRPTAGFFAALRMTGGATATADRLGICPTKNGDGRGRM